MKIGSLPARPLRLRDGMALPAREAGSGVEFDDDILARHLA